MGDGAVGIAVAVALSSKYNRVILAGPPGTEAKTKQFSVEGTFSAKEHIEHTSIDLLPKAADFVVVAVKAYHVSDISHTLSQITCKKIISLTNGIGYEACLEGLSVEYAVLSMGFEKLTDSMVATAEGSVICEKESIVTVLFDNSFISQVFVPDIDEYRWSKWFVNSIINPIASLTGLANNQLLGNDLGLLVDELSKELEQLMPSEHSVLLGKELLEWLLHSSTNRCSMLKDIENGNPTEIDYLTGLAVRKLPSKCPTASILVSLIKAHFTENQ